MALYCLNHCSASNDVLGVPVYINLQRFSDVHNISKTSLLPGLDTQLITNICLIKSTDSLESWFFPNSKKNLSSTATPTSPCRLSGEMTTE